MRPRVYLYAPRLEPAYSLPGVGSGALLKPSFAMAWYCDYESRKERLLRHGLLVLVEEVRVDPATGFLAIYLQANDSDLLRSNTDREFPLHITLGYASDYGNGVAAEAAQRLNNRWRGRLVRLAIDWVGGGGSIQLAANDLFVMDEDVYWLHSRGWYGNGVNCLPRSLHVSLLARVS